MHLHRTILAFAATLSAVSALDFPPFTFGTLTYIPDPSVDPQVSMAMSINTAKLVGELNDAIAEADTGHNKEDLVPAAYTWPPGQAPHGNYLINFHVTPGREITYGGLFAGLSEIREQIKNTTFVWTVSGKLNNPDPIGTYEVFRWW